MVSFSRWPALTENRIGRTVVEAVLAAAAELLSGWAVDMLGGPGWRETNVQGSAGKASAQMRNGMHSGAVREAVRVFECGSSASGSTRSTDVWRVARVAALQG